MKQNKIAMIYDFDGTLTPKTMQEYTLLPKLGLNPKSFWDSINEESIDLFKDIAWQIINEKVDAVGDWVNNEGGYGHLEIDVYKKTYDLTYSQRTTEEYDWSDEFLFI